MDPIKTPVVEPPKSVAPPPPVKAQQPEQKAPQAPPAPIVTDPKPKA